MKLSIQKPAILHATPAATIELEGGLGLTVAYCKDIIGIMLLKKLIPCFIIIVLSMTSVHADIIHFKDGRKLEGKIKTETREEVTLIVLMGAGEAEVPFPMADIDRIEKKNTVTNIYLSRRKRARGNYAALGKLAQWCRDKGLKELAELNQGESDAAFKRKFLEKCPTARCTVCNGQGTDGCKGCGGSGILPEFSESFGNRILVNSSPVDPLGNSSVLGNGNSSETPAVHWPLAGDTVFANVYQKDRDGNITNKVNSLRVKVYKNTTAGRFEEVARLEDNMPLKVIERKMDVTSSYVEVRLQDNSTVLIHQKNIRKNKLKYSPCPVCNRKGEFRCPACNNGLIKKGANTFKCRVCDCTAKVRCRHCQGLGSRRIK